VVLRDDRRTLKYRVDLFHLLIAQQAELHGPDVFLHLRDRLKAGDGNSPLAARPDPGQGDLRLCSTIAGVSEVPSHGLDALAALRCPLRAQVPGAAPIVFREQGITVELAGHVTTPERGADDAGLIVRFTDCQHFRHVGAHIHPMLNRRAILSLRKDPRPFFIDRAPTIPADLSLLDQPFQEVAHITSLLRWIIILVKLVQVDMVGLQAAQAGFALLADAGEGHLPCE